MNRTGQVDFASGANIVLGAWLVIAPFILGYSNVSTALWNDILFGLAILILAWVRVANPASATALSWINAVIGLWLIAVPFIFAFTPAAVALWNNVIVGILVAAMGTWSALATSTAT